MTHCSAASNTCVWSSATVWHIGYLTSTRLALEALLPCVNQVFPTIQPGKSSPPPLTVSFQACESSCQTDRIAAGLTVKQLFQEDIKLLKILDQHMGRLTGNEACRVSQCMLRCYRTRLNVRCDGAAGSILSEGLMRPYSQLHEIGSLFAPLMANLIPMQCNFLTEPNEMREFRIDHNFDQHVKNKYKELKVVLKMGCWMWVKEMANTQRPLPPYVDPFANVSMTDKQSSPLDVEWINVVVKLYCVVVEVNERCFRLFEHCKGWIIDVVRSFGRL